jgi:hypothetical protein
MHDPRGALTPGPDDGALLAIHNVGAQIAAAAVVQVKRIEAAEEAHGKLLQLGEHIVDDEVGAHMPRLVVRFRDHRPRDSRSFRSCSTSRGSIRWTPVGVVAATGNSPSPDARGDAR